MSASAAAPPTQYGASAEGKAIHAIFSAVAAVDPALAATRATAQVDPAGAPPIQLSSYGYNNDPGTLAGAVIFAPGNPTQPQNTPGLSEAFFPEPDQEHVAKCAFNNDATDTQRSAVCDQTNTGSEYALADVQPKNPLGPSARGFASSAGATIGNGVPLKANHVTSDSNIVPDADGNLTVLQENKGNDITIPGTPITIGSFEASTHLKSTATEVTGDAVCTIQVNIAGQPVPTDQVAAALAALPPSPVGDQLTFAFTPPTAPVVTEDAVGGSASCTGAVLTVNNASAGNSATYVFGETIARAAKLGQTLGSSSDSSGSTGDSGSGSFGASGSTDSGSSSSSGSSATGIASTGSSSTGTGSDGSFASPTATSATPTSQAAAPAAASAPQQEQLAGPKLIKKKFSGLGIGLVTAAGAAAIGLGTWLLIGAVSSMAARGGIRLAGWQAPR